MAALALAFAPGTSAAAVTFTVINNGDNGGVDPAVGAGTGTLRQAIVDATAKDLSLACVNAGATITFSGPFTTATSNPIRILAALKPLECNPTIIGGGQVTIDGVDKTISCGLFGNTLSGISGLEITGFQSGLCGSLNVFANRIHGNFTGIQLSSGRIGDGTSDFRNYIYSNSTANISINEGSGAIFENFIGTADGVNAAPGNGIGVDLQYTSVDVTTNIISGNTTGVRIRSATGSKLSANKIGTDFAGTSAVPNTIGVDLVQCGGNVTLEYNTISGNTSHGVQAASPANIYTNHIGTDPSGRNLVANGGAGIRFFYGGCLPSVADVYDNDIAFNDMQGITVTDWLGVSISGNRIFGNRGKNIDLGNNSGALPNDAGDLDTGANNQQNHPVITSVTQASGNTTVAYTLDSQPGFYWVDFYANPADGVPAGEISTNQTAYIQLVTGAVSPSFTYSMSGSFDYMTVTATRDGSPCCDTSEFSDRVKAAVGPVPSAYLTRSVMDFGDVALGTSSGTLDSLVVSSGTGPYTIDSFTDYGGGAICYGGPFSCQTDCLVDGVGVTLNPGKKCTVTAKFDATTLIFTGSYSRRLKILDNTSASPRYIDLKANAVVPPPVMISPSTWDFGSVLIGRQSDPQTFSIANPGASDVAIGAVTTTGDFVVQGTDCGSTVPAGGSCGAVVAFYPKTQGPSFGTVQVSGTAGGPPLIFRSKVTSDVSPPTTASADLAGNGITQAQLQLPTRIDFGAYSVGFPALSRTVQLSNSGNADLVISQISTAAPFTVTTNCPTLLPRGAVCDITVRFSSTVVGEFDGTLTIVSNGEGASGNIPLHARAVAAPRPEVRLSAATMGFGERLLGTTTATQRVTITNIGNTPATIVSLTTSNEDFHVAGTSCATTLLPAATCFADIAMRPAGFGLRTGQFLFTSNALGSPHTVDLTGTGCRPYNPSSARTGGPRSNCAP